MLVVKTRNGLVIQLRRRHLSPSRVHQTLREVRALAQANAAREHSEEAQVYEESARMPISSGQIAPALRADGRALPSLVAVGVGEGAAGLLAIHT